MVEIAITPLEVTKIEQAIPTIRKRINFTGKNAIESITVGFLGEWVAYQWAYNGEADLDKWLAVQTKTHRSMDDGGDIKLHVNGNGKRNIEVRSRMIYHVPLTRDTVVIDSKRIPPESRHILLFVCVEKEFKRAWLTGWVTRDEWLDRSKPLMPGEKFALSQRTATRLMIQIDMQSLNPITELHCSKN